MSSLIRLATNDDAQGIIDLIARCYADYPPNILDVDTEEPELKTPASSFDGFWVLEVRNEILGSIAATNLWTKVRPHCQDAVEMKKYYIHPKVRGSGEGRKLHDVFLEYVKGQKINKVVLWTDTRFSLAHKVYEHMGYIKTGQTRELNDISQTTEFHFELNL